MGNASARKEFNAEDLEDQDEADLGDDEGEEEETEEQWRARREGQTQSRLDQIKRMLAVAFFAGLGIIVIVVVLTSVPLVAPPDENSTDGLNATTAPPTGSM